MQAVDSGLPALAYFAVVLTVGEVARRGLGLAPDVTRKLVLGLVALWSIPAMLLLPDPRAAAFPFLVLAAVLYLSFRFELFAAIEDDGASLGSVLAPLSAALLFGLLGRESAPIAVAGVLAMGIGDGAAAVVGRRLGTRRYRVWGHARTMEGALALFLLASAVVAPVLARWGGLDWHQAVAFALIGGTVAASVEALSPYGLDNLTVPLSTAGTLMLLVRATS